MHPLFFPNVTFEKRNVFFGTRVDLVGEIKKFGTPAIQLIVCS